MADRPAPVTDLAWSPQQAEDLGTLDHAFLPTPPLHQNIGFDLLDEFLRCQLIENSDLVDAIQSHQNLGTVFSTKNGAPRALDTLHRFIAVDPHYQFAPESASFLKKLYMPFVQYVETAVCEYDHLRTGAEMSGDIIA